MTRKHIEQLASSSPVPSDFIGLPYSPALLLDGRLAVSITDDPAFSSACEWGFDFYFEEAIDFDLGASQDRFYTANEVVKAVRYDITHFDPVFDNAPLVDRVGIMLGWLSAMALAQYQEAKEGLKELCSLMDRMGVE